ncbi:hypothetical protein QQF64_027184 [Cirrhinus molitorella]|uniref:DUF2442 domain-containing protein n=1 Tax=Cirrhinus molitorella TaxID=172907 RepID=A0ABR3NBS3_9TELE
MRILPHTLVGYLTEVNSASAFHHTPKPRLARSDPRDLSGRKRWAFSPDGALTWPDQAPEVTVETRQALARTGSLALSPTVETRILLRWIATQAKNLTEGFIKSKMSCHCVIMA